MDQPSPYKSKRLGQTSEPVVADSRSVQQALADNNPLDGPVVARKRPSEASVRKDIDRTLALMEEGFQRGSGGKKATFTQAVATAAGVRAKRERESS